MTDIVRYYNVPAWNGNATTITQLEGNGGYSWNIGQGGGVVVGLAKHPSGGHYDVQTHSISFDSTYYRIKELGSDPELAPIMGRYEKTDVFRIIRTSGEVTYYKNATLLYTSKVASTGTVILDAALYLLNDEIQDVSFSELPFESLSAITNTYQFYSRTSDSDKEWGFGRYEFAVSGVSILDRLAASNSYGYRALGSEAGSCWGYNAYSYTSDQIKTDHEIYSEVSNTYQYRSQSGDNSLRIFSQYSYTQTLDTLPPPDVIFVDGEYIYISAGDAYDSTPFTISNTYELNAKLSDTDGYWPYNTYRYDSFIWSIDGSVFFYGALPGLVTQIVGVIHAEVDAPVTYSLSGFSISAEMPAPNIEIDGTVNTSGIVLTLSEPTLTVLGGGRVTVTVEAPELVSAASLPNFGTVAAEVDSPELTVSGFVGFLGSVENVVTAPTLSMKSGGVMVIELPIPVITSAGTVTSLADISITVGTPLLTSTGFVGVVGSISAEVAIPVLTSTGWQGVFGSVAITLPTIESAVFDVAAPESTYVVNLATGAITQWQLGTVNRLVTAHGVLYALKDGALYKVDGETDNGTDITMTVHLASQTFKSAFRKRAGDVYVQCRENDGINLTVVQDEITTWTYQTTTDASPAYGTHKIKVGHGIVFHSAGLILQNRDGGRLDIGGVEWNVEQLTRRPR